MKKMDTETTGTGKEGMEMEKERNKNNTAKTQENPTFLEQIEHELDASMRVGWFWHTNYRRGSLFAPGAMGGIRDFHCLEGEDSDDSEELLKDPDGEDFGDLEELLKELLKDSEGEDSDDSEELLKDPDGEDFDDSEELLKGPDEEELEITAEVLKGHKRVAEKMLCRRMMEKSVMNFEKHLAELVEKAPESKESARILEFAKHLLFHSANEEAVRTALILLGQFKNMDQETIDAILDLALYDELTEPAIVCLHALMGDENFDEVLFEILKHTYGWGRVEGMRYWRPNTPEMRRWLLMGGFRNYILPDYTIVKAVEKSELVNRLEGDMTLEEFRYASEMVREIFDDHGMNISAICWLEDSDGQQCGERLLFNYLKKWREWMSVPGIAQLPVYREAWQTIYAIWNGIFYEKEMGAVVEEMKKTMQWFDEFCASKDVRMKAAWNED